MFANVPLNVNAPCSKRQKLRPAIPAWSGPPCVCPAATALPTARPACEASLQGHRRIAAVSMTARQYLCNCHRRSVQATAHPRCVSRSCPGQNSDGRSRPRGRSGQHPDWRRVWLRQRQATKNKPNRRLCTSAHRRYFHWHEPAPKAKPCVARPSLPASLPPPRAGTSLVLGWLACANLPSQLPPPGAGPRSAFQGQRARLPLCPI